jgi:putative selenium metabolism hydrolase
MKDIRKVLEGRKEEMTSFLKALVRIQSPTGHEKEMALAIRDRMEKLGFDSAEIDEMGNVVGTVGEGEPLFLFDCHMDTVGVADAPLWKHDPYGGETENERLYGRGSSDMKAGIVSALYALAALKECSLVPEGRSLILSCTVAEEDYEGVALRYVLDSRRIRPRYVVIPEPTDDFRVASGHRGRALVEITAKGKTSHACYPEKGENAIYMLTPVIERIRKRNEEYSALPGEHPSMSVTTYRTVSAGENAVPGEAVITVDRRSITGETEEYVKKEFDSLVCGLDSISWRFKDYEASSWTGMEFTYHNCVLAWELEEDNPLVQNALSSVAFVRSHRPPLFHFSGSTNAVTSAGLYGIDTVIIGPGRLSVAHSRDEYCPVKDLLDASLIYAEMVIKAETD